MDVRIENHHGVDVFVSAQAEAARKQGCLCVHQEPIDRERPELGSKTVMCRHLRANIKYEKKVKMEKSAIANISEAGSARLTKIAIQARAIEESENICFASHLVAGSDEYMFASDGVCRMALVNYAVCLSGNLAMAVTRCPYYEAEKITSGGMVKTF